jgi:glycine/D-amino acid oxidase-like deaminating enzyme
MAQTFDAAVIGGGVMGCTTALHLARGGMRAVLFEKGGLCREASGRNAGTLTLMYTRAALIPYTMRGRELWRDAPQWLGRSAGFNHREGLEVVFTQNDAAELEDHMMKRAAAGAPIEIVGGNRAREIEPALSPQVVAAAYCKADGYAHSYESGVLFHQALAEAGVDVRDNTRVESVVADGDGHRIEAGAKSARAKTVVLSGGVWISKMAEWFGFKLPITCRINQGTISERLPRLFRVNLRVFNEISLKQSANGTVLMGGGKGEHWIADPDRGAEQMDPEKIRQKMVNAVASACKTVPALRMGRVARTWTGYEGFAPDNMPIIGPLPGKPGVFVIGCQRSGFTTGPFMGKLLADALLGREPEMPILRPEFDPKRVLAMAPVSEREDAQSA